tara:strand:- start:68 stop:514 length:447 start_codon:yes stop_codon:yes gene_type:complete
MIKFQKLVEQHFDLEINKKTRVFKYVFARACYYELCQKYTKNSLAKISSSVNKTHATVINALKELPYMLKSNILFSDQYTKLQFKAEKLIVITKKKMDLNTLVNNYNILLINNDLLKKTVKNLRKRNKKLFINSKEMKRIIYIMADTD